MQIIVDNFKTIIRKNDSYHDLIYNNVNSLTNNINYLNKEYGIGDLRFLFADLSEQVDDVFFISSIVKNYSDVLLDILTTYQLLEKHVITHIENETRKLL